MSLNTAHVNGGVLIHAGEAIILFSDDVVLKFTGQQRVEFHGQKSGRIYLTTHRIIFNNKNKDDALLSFSFPFVALRDVNIEQPIFRANCVRGVVVAQSNGNWEGTANFKVSFNAGGAIEFGQALLAVSRMAAERSNLPSFGNPPPYSPPQSSYYAAPPPAYSAAPEGYYGWTPPTQTFPQQPPANSVFMTDMPPPYPGLQAGPTPAAFAGNFGQTQPGFQMPAQASYPYQYQQQQHQQQEMPSPFSTTQNSQGFQTPAYPVPNQGQQHQPSAPNFAQNPNSMYPQNLGFMSSNQGGGF